MASPRSSSLLLGFILAFIFALGACASSSAPPDLANPPRNFCPDNPQFCVDGVCCGTACVDTKINARNCGGCGIQCEANSVCAGGKCGCQPSGTACGSGQTCCGNAGCKSLSSDINNCGSCGHKCGDGSTCENGNCLCGGVACAAGQTCCQGTCAASCGTAADMAMPGPCQCPSGCPLSKTCVGPNCCFEDYLIAKTCQPDPSCLQSSP